MCVKHCDEWTLTRPLSSSLTETCYRGKTTEILKEHNPQIYKHMKLTKKKHEEDSEVCSLKGSPLD